MNFFLYRTAECLKHGSYRVVVFVVVIFALVQVGSSHARADHNQPLEFEADSLEGAVDDLTRAKGQVRLKQGDLRIRADELTHTQADNTARAIGRVRISRQGNVYQGDQLRMALDTMEGEFLRPTYWFSKVKAGGKAAQIDFKGENRVVAKGASYTSCTPENTAEGTASEPDWELTTSEIDMNFADNEGRASNAVIWFKGVPILATPILVFPLNDQRKSGLLPPSIAYDNRSGFEFSIPYYWNIAPNYDATITPTYAAKRGYGFDTEFRYLLPGDRGTLRIAGLPNDQLRETDRGMFDFQHGGQRVSRSGYAFTQYDLRWRRVSDDNYWKDFPRTLPSNLPRLYDSHGKFEHQLNVRNWGLGESQTSLFGGIQSWQTLRDLDPTTSSLSEVIAPYGRQQLGLNSRKIDSLGVLWSINSEANRFTHQDPSKQTGQRLHAVASVAKVLGTQWGLSITPRLSINAAQYRLDHALNDGRRTLSRTIPTFSLDMSAVFERPVSIRGEPFTQTLEPRIRYTRTPFVDQSDIPLFDSAARVPTQYAFYSDNGYTGNDRVTDANQIALSATSRLMVPNQGIEVMRFDVIQKVLLSDQKINPAGDEPITQRFSDMLLSANTTIIPKWNLGSQVLLDGETSQTKRVLWGATYNPSPYRVINANYSYARDSNNQINLGWQWPVAGNSDSLTSLFRDRLVSSTGSSNLGPGTGCSGTWYAVGHVNYSIRDKRLANALYGVEYDAGCWIGRVVVEQLALGKETASSRIMFQLELVGLSRLGSSPLSALRDNIPGYRTLRDGDTPSPTPGLPNTLSDD